MMLSPGLYVVATPIGNLQDISLRAIEILRAVDKVAAEDTRHTGRLLKHHGIRADLVSLHEHNEERRVPDLLALMQQGGTLALVSDAGTPLLSDPGYRLVSAAADAGIGIFTVPGASAITAAVSISGLPCDRFCFEGFVPAKPAARRAWIADRSTATATLVLFESAHRVRDCLADLAEAFGTSRRAALCRELTKQFETVLRGTLSELIERLESDPEQRKGEFVIVIEGAAESGSALDGVKLAQALVEELSPAQAARVAARVSGHPRREIYEALVKPGL